MLQNVENNHWYGKLLVFPHTHNRKSFFQFQAKSLFLSVRKFSTSSSFSGNHDYSSSVIYSHISFWCNQMGSAFLLMNSSTSIPSMAGGRLIRFCFPFTKIVMYSFCRCLFSPFQRQWVYVYALPWWMLLFSAIALTMSSGQWSHNITMYLNKPVAISW